MQSVRVGVKRRVSFKGSGLLLWSSPPWTESTQKLEAQLIFSISEIVEDVVYKNHYKC